MIHVLYHDSCYDGFACAFIARFVNPSCTLHPVSYGTPIPEIPDDQTVWILDFSYPKDILLALANRSAGVTVLDHHKTAEENLRNLTAPKLNIVFDMNESGATLTWKHFVSAHVPDFIKYIRDRDLWLFELSGSKEFSAWLASYPRDLEVWNKLRLTPIPDAVREGTAILRFQDQKVEEICKGAVLKNISGYEVPVVNRPYGGVFASEVGNLLCKQFPKAAFSAAYCDNLLIGKKLWSLRSIGDFDVSAIASSMGGGGHRNAAGFEEDIV
jgi:oligoribonuclease NrnB/cAMP/cGMP phosphodiesterase (DHH superfamily)